MTLLPASSWRSQQARVLERLEEESLQGVAEAVKAELLASKQHKSDSREVSWHGTSSVLGKWSQLVTLPVAAVAVLMLLMVQGPFSCLHDPASGWQLAMAVEDEMRTYQKSWNRVRRRRERRILALQVREPLGGSWFMVQTC